MIYSVLPYALPILVFTLFSYLFYKKKWGNIFSVSKGSLAPLVSLIPSHRPPKHIAVIMDGNRRFGRAKYNDPLQVKRAFHLLNPDRV